MYIYSSDDKMGKGSRVVLQSFCWGILALGGSWKQNSLLTAGEGQAFLGMENNAGRDLAQRFKGPVKQVAGLG